MACCSNPKIKSSPLCDWCENCGWEYDYVNCTESGGTYQTDDQDEDEGIDYRY